MTEIVCPLCKRINDHQSNHHLIPACRDGNADDKVIICESCHLAIHQLFSNKQLEETYNSVESLLSHEVFAKTAKFICKQKGFVKTKLANNQRHRGRNG
jgi:hypothetical protein